MKRIIRIGMDVHSTNYTLCAMEPILGGEDRIFANIQVTPDYKNIILFIEDLKLKLGLDEEYDILCGYEAGCLGYSLYNQLTGAGIKCEILAPTTMLTLQGVRIKTDARDALMIRENGFRCQEFNVSADYFYFETDKPLVEDNTISITDAFTKELEQCTDLEKQQLMEMLKILRMKPVAV